MEIIHVCDEVSVIVEDESGKRYLMVMAYGDLVLREIDSTEPLFETWYSLARG